jgi:hypothetical protein
MTAYSGKMSLPVDPSSLLYSHFEHVSGVLAPEGTQGVSISKINLLDVLIGRLNQVKKSSSTPFLQGPPAGRTPATRNMVPPAPAERPGTVQNNVSNFDALVDNFRNQLKQAKAASEAMPYIPSPNTQPGALFSLLT